jgi:hypothetical protein
VELNKNYEQFLNVVTIVDDIKEYFCDKNTTRIAPTIPSFDGGNRNCHNSTIIFGDFHVHLLSSSSLHFTQ